MDNRLINKDYKTPLGTINCGLTSNKASICMVDRICYHNGKSEIYKSSDFQFEMIQFKVKLPL